VFGQHHNEWKDDPWMNINGGFVLRVLMGRHVMISARRAGGCCCWPRVLFASSLFRGVRMISDHHQILNIVDVCIELLLVILQEDIVAGVRSIRSCLCW